MYYKYREAKISSLKKLFRTEVNTICYSVLCDVVTTMVLKTVLWNVTPLILLYT